MKSSSGVPRLFGTDGIRALAGKSPLDGDTVHLIGKSLASNLQTRNGRTPRILTGRDTRESGPDIESALHSGVLAAGARVESAGVITTPGIAYLTRTLGFDAGVVISASHNPYRDNGIKVFEPSGKKLADEAERAIEADVAAALEAGASVVKQPQRVTNPEARKARESKFRLRYLDYLLSEIAQGLSLEGFAIGLDCAHGAASYYAPDLFLRLGAYVQVIGGEPDGRNINEHCGSLHLDPLRELVVEYGLPFGVAFDGDADRALFVDSSGEVVDGDATLLILADYLKAQGRLAGDLVVATVMSNIGLELALKERGIELVRAQVGDRYVLEELLLRGASVGGEQSGHIIFPETSLAGDGLITALMLLRAVRESDSTLAELAGQLTRYPQVLVNVRVASKPPLESIPAVRDEIGRLEEKLKGKGRLLVRYSGTENLARVMIEGENQQQIEEDAQRLAGILESEIGAR